MLGEWQKLDEVGRVAWLERARARMLKSAEAGHHAPSRVEVTIDGNDFDDLTGFFCAIGEAVNGPGGYFGATLQGFDDCLFGGFGLEAPCTITWLHSKRSRATLGPRALARQCAESIAAIDTDPDAQAFAAGRAALVEMLALAERGERTLFDEIVTLIESVPDRQRGRSIALHLA
jgi:RNAse (barnase) inhibitor barstar